jgi:hypothetical protein
MSALGELPPVDAAIHADTTHERTETYEFAAKWTPWLEERGVRVRTVSDEHAAYEVLLDPDNGQTHMPAFTRRARLLWHEGRILGYWPTEKAGMYRRSCTQRWKIAPMRRYIQLLRQDGEQVEQWIGITLDEWSRMRDSDVKYIDNVYPFMEMDPPMSRHAVMRWLLNNGLEIPVKSSCVFCPFHDRATWRELKLNGNGDWQAALEMDRLIRQKRIGDGYVGYVHSDRLPLDQVDLRNAQDHGQLELWGEECTGTCFL